MSEQVVERLTRRFSQLSSDKTSRISEFQEISEFLQPERAHYYSLHRVNTTTDRGRIFDSTSEDALSILAAGLHTHLTSPVHIWFSLGLIMGEEESTDDIKGWIDEVEKRMLAKFGSETAGFHSAVHELYLDLPAIGTGGFFVDEPDDVRFMCIPLSELTCAENANGVIDIVFREFTMSARQIRERFDDKFSDAVRNALENEPDKKFTVVHAIEPRDEFDPESIKPSEMQYASYYYEKDSKKLLKESGFQEMPMMIPRWSKTSGETYGRGIGQKALPDIRVLNEMQRSALIAAEKQAAPITLLPHDGFIGEFLSDGDSLNYYRSTGDIRDKVMQLGSDADLNTMLILIQAKQDSIRKMFLNDKLQQVGGPQMTATEVIAVQNEKMRILGPVLGRLQTEFLAPLVNRVFKIMLRNGELPPPPEELQGQDIRVQYVSPISRAQKQTEAEAFGQAMSFMAPIIQMNPAVLGNFDMDAIVRDTQPMFGYPSKYLKSPDRIKKEQQAAQEQASKEQAAQETDVGLTLAQKAKDLKNVEG